MGGYEWALLALGAAAGFAIGLWVVIAVRGTK